MNNDAIFQAYLLVFGNTVAMMVLMTVLVVWLNYRRRKKLLDAIEVVVTTFNNGIAEKKQKIRPWVHAHFGIEESEIDEQVENLIRREKAFYEATFSTIISKNIDSIKNYPEVIDEFLENYTHGFQGAVKTDADHSKPEVQEKAKPKASSLESEVETNTDEGTSLTKAPLAEAIESDAVDLNLDTNIESASQNVIDASGDDAKLLEDESLNAKNQVSEVTSVVEENEVLLDEKTQSSPQEPAVDEAPVNKKVNQDELAAALAKTKEALKAATEKKSQKTGDV